MEFKYINNEEEKVIKLLNSLNQTHLTKLIANYSNDERQAFTDQVKNIYNRFIF